MAASFPFFGLVSSMGVISFVAIQLRGKARAWVYAGVLFRCLGICLKLLKLLTLTASQVEFNYSTESHFFRRQNRVGKCHICRGFMQPAVCHQLLAFGAGLDDWDSG